MTVDDVVKGLKLCASHGSLVDICPGCPYYKQADDPLTIYICSPCLKEMQRDVQELGPFAYFSKRRS